MLQYSEFTKRVAGRSGYAWAIHMDALKLRDAGQDVIMLTVGDPDQPPPEALIDTAVAALRAHHTGYSGIVGYPALRQAIAKRHSARTGRPCAAENVVIVPGAQGGLFCALLCLAGPGGTDHALVGGIDRLRHDDLIAGAGEAQQCAEQPALRTWRDDDVLGRTGPAGSPRVTFRDRLAQRRIADNA